jgi:hypothetical protein
MMSSAEMRAEMRRERKERKAELSGFRYNAAQMREIRGKQGEAVNTALPTSLVDESESESLSGGETNSLDLQQFETSFEQDHHKLSASQSKTDAAELRQLVETHRSQMQAMYRKQRLHTLGLDPAKLIAQGMHYMFDLAWQKVEHFIPNHIMEVLELFEDAIEHTAELITMIAECFAVPVGEAAVRKLQIA